MKTVDSDNENSNNYLSCVDTEEVTDSLIDNKEAHSLIKCNPDLVQSYNVLKSPMGQKGRFYQRVLLKNNVTQDFRSQSLPNSLDNKNSCNGSLNVMDCCDTHTKLLLEQDSSQITRAKDLWFNTWPERCEKLITDDGLQSFVNGTNSHSSHTHLTSKICDNTNDNGSVINNKITLNEALQNISLAYSPITKQLHLVEKQDSTTEKSCVDASKYINEDQHKEVLNPRKSGHKRTEAGSFSSTISSLSDPSPSGSLLDAEEQFLTDNDSNNKPKKKGLSNFFSRNIFTWKSNSIAAAGSGGWKLFHKSTGDGCLESSPQHQQYCDVVASSSALIQNIRPSNLPAKTDEEEQRHREEYREMLAAVKKKEVQSTAAKLKQQKLQLHQEEQLAAATKHFMHQVLPNWENLYNTRKTRDLWWQGLPSSVRGKVWRLAIGNDLNLTQQLYEICLSRAQNRLNSPEPSHHESDVDQESSMDVIQLDIARTFPNLCIFQEGGPYSDVLHSLLAAYVCYRPDVGYVQGMSYIAAVLILNMEEFYAFICFANLLNRPLHLAAFTLNQNLMQSYYNAYNDIFQYNLSKLFSHFENSGLSPDLYLLDWVYTIFAKAMPLDVACRIWDLILRDGEEFIFRTALGILHLYQDILIHMDFLHGAQFLTRLPDDISSEQLFKSIQVVNTNVGKQTFSQIFDRYKSSMSEL